MVQHLVENEGVRVTVIGTPGTISGQIAPYVRVVDFAEIKENIQRAAPA